MEDDLQRARGGREEQGDRGKWTVASGGIELHGLQDIVRLGNCPTPRTGLLLTENVKGEGKSNTSRVGIS